MYYKLNVNMIEHDTLKGNIEKMKLLLKLYQT